MQSAFFMVISFYGFEIEKTGIGSPLGSAGLQPADFIKRMIVFFASSAESVGKYWFWQITKGYDTWLFAGNRAILEF